MTARNTSTRSPGSCRSTRLFAVLETLDNGKPIREAATSTSRSAQRHFYYHAGLAQLLAEELPGTPPLGVCGQIIPWNFPLLMLAWKIAPALAAGQHGGAETGGIHLAHRASLRRYLPEAGLPKGVVNIVTGDGATGQAIVEHPGIAKIAFTGSTAVGRRIRETTAGTGKALTLELGGKSPYIVFDDADIDSAIEGLVDAIWFNQGQVCCAGSRLFVQEGIAEDFHTGSRRGWTSCASATRSTNASTSARWWTRCSTRDHRMVDANTEGEVYRAATDMPETGLLLPADADHRAFPRRPLMQEEIFGPVLVSGTFRTPAEAVQLANNTRYGLAATVWTENLNLALDIAPKLAAGVVWVNATNLFDAAAPFGGLRESGFGREGGWEGLAGLPEARHRAETRQDRSTPHPGPKPSTPRGSTGRPRCMSGGKQARPDGGYSQPSTAKGASFSAMPGSATARISATRWRPRAGPRDGPRPPGICGRRSSITSPRTSRPARTSSPLASAT
jgi:aldehyde dehydrogenase (NAD+)